MWRLWSLKEEIMMRYALMVAVLCPVFVDRAADADAEQERAVAAIQRLGGKVIRDEGGPGRPVAAVFLRDRGADTALVHLKAFPHLRKLYLRCSDVSDTGLKHLTGLTDLEALLLADTAVTDAGLGHLRGLTRLQRLDLSDTGVGDMGLEHLTALKTLRLLNLMDTKVTDEGVKRLQAALPMLTIVR